MGIIRIHFKAFYGANLRLKILQIEGRPIGYVSKSFVGECRFCERPHKRSIRHDAGDEAGVGMRHDRLKLIRAIAEE